MVSEILYSHKTDEWSTPQDFFDTLDDEFHFSLDVCANEQNHKCERYFSKADDGLKMTWGGGDCMVQSTLWPRNRQVGEKVCYAQGISSHAIACAYRHTLVPQLHLPEGRNTVYQRKAQVWREQKLGTVPKHGCNL